MEAYHVGMEQLSAKTAGHIAEVTGLSPKLLDERGIMSSGYLYHWQGVSRLKEHTLDFEELVLFLHLEGDHGVPMRVGGQVLEERSNPGGVIIAPQGYSADFVVNAVDTLTLHIDMKQWVGGMSDAVDPVTLRNISFSYAEQDDILRSCLLGIGEEARLVPKSRNLYCDSLVDAIMMRVLRNYSRESFRNFSKGGLSSLVLRRSIDAIEHGIEYGISLDELAVDANLSRWHFSRMFQQSTGMAPHRYLTWRRIEKAKELLRKTTMSIGEIALACGFSSQSHLSSVFVKYVNETPKSFRHGH